MQNVERVVSTEATSPNEESIDRALRPVRLADYVGQKAVREQLEIFIAAAKQRGEPLDHLLVFGPGQNDAGSHRSQRNGRQPAPDFRPRS